MMVKLLSRAAVKGGDGQCLRVQIPYIRTDLPILVVFRALGFVVRSSLAGWSGAGLALGVPELRWQGSQSMHSLHGAAL